VGHVTPRPPVLTTLAVLAMVLGAGGGLSSVSTVVLLTETRDHYMAKAFPAEQRDSQAFPDEFLKEAEREAEAYYNRRGVAIPLAGVNFIVSILLFLAAGALLRGRATSIGSFRFAALVNIPYHVLQTVFSLVQIRDISMTPSPGSPLSESLP